jgi:hypothetical protein
VRHFVGDAGVFDGPSYESTSSGIGSIRTVFLFLGLGIGLVGPGSGAREEVIGGPGGGAREEAMGGAAVSRLGVEKHFFVGVMSCSEGSLMV